MEQLYFLDAPCIDNNRYCLAWLNLASWICDEGQLSIINMLRDSTHVAQGRITQDAEEYT